MKKQVIHFESCGRSGNIFFVLGMVRTVMQKERRITEYNDMWQEVQKCGSYETALKIIGKRVPLIDDATGERYGEV